MISGTQGIHVEDIPVRTTSVRSTQESADQLQAKIRSLHRAASALTSRIEDLELFGFMFEPPAVESGIDFYEEVTRFERSLIIRALRHTGGSQKKAALLLKMNHTTLNTKMKNLNIKG
jgi:DNA-binding NtrC family response regulator